MMIIRKPYVSLLKQGLLQIYEIELISFFMQKHWTHLHQVVRRKL